MSGGLVGIEPVRPAGASLESNEDARRLLLALGGPGSHAVEHRFDLILGHPRNLGRGCLKSKTAVRLNQRTLASGKTLSVFQSLGGFFRVPTLAMKSVKMPRFTTSVVNLISGCAMISRSSAFGVLSPLTRR